MTFEQLLSDLRRKDIHLWVEGDRLRYQGPESAVTESLLVEIKKRKQEIIKYLESARDTHSNPTSIAVVAREADGLPLSFAQQPLWFLEQLQPANTSNHLTSAFRIQGPLDKSALERGIETIIERHEILRTTFRAVDGVPRQIIHPSAPLKIAEAELQDLPDIDKERELQRQLTAEIQRPFDLADGPLLRVKLFHLADAEHVLLLTMHHIISDGWSYGIFYRELNALYGAFSTGESLQLDDVKVQYGDYAAWQRQQEPSWQSQLPFWKEQLAGTLPVLELPTDRPRPAVQTYRGHRHFFALPAETYRQLKSLSQREGCSLFMALLAAVHVLLHRYTGQYDLIVGSPVSNRRRPELEDSIGIFLNMIVLRGNLSGDPRFAALMQQTRRTSLDAFAHQDVPFEKLVEELQPQRDPSRNPLFQVMIQLSSLAGLELADLAVTPVTTDGGGSQFDLAIHLNEGTQGVRGYFEFNTDLFDDHTIERMVGHFQSLLNGIVSDPQQRVSELSLLSEAEEHQLLMEWNDTSVAYPDNSCMHELFLAQVRQTPDRIAAVFEHQQLTYSELNQRADQLAHHLQRLGVGPEELVGIYVDRSLDMLVALLGVMKAGGAYVPLDPSFPSERLAFLVEDADVAALITQPHLRDTFPHYSGAIVDIVTDWNQISGEDMRAPASDVNSENLAYVIYTSGSTGKPKGVQICHRALVNFLFSMRKEPELTEQDILLAVTTLSFDIAALELYLPLIAGAKTVLVSQQNAADGAALREELVRSGVTIMQATPSTWQLMIDAGWRDPLPLKILCGGEALPRELANQLVKRGSSLWNMYGPTETTIWSSVKQTPGEASPVLIGTPLANTTFYILDAELQPVPVGVPGELYIGGDGLARGYLNRPSLTAEKFINNPFNPDASRLYRSGDLVRHRPNGDIEFLGRLDHQIKLRGFRIELGEIEAVLNHHPTVSQAVAVVREDVPGDKRIVAYVVATAAETLRVDDLRSYLRDKLAEYMIPSAFVQLDAFPTTPNGKVDRNALPAPAGERQTEEQYTAPRNDLEGSISEIWQQLLQVNEVGIHDNFFDLGGHSLLLAHMQSRLRGITQKQLPIVEFFRYPTVAALAEFLAADNDVQQDRMSTSNMIQDRGQRQKAALQRRRQLAGQRRRW